MFPVIKFFLRKNNDKENSFVLYVRVSLNGKTAELSLREKIDPNEWNQSAQKIYCKDKAKESFINDFIEKISFELKSTAYKLPFEVLTPKKLIDHLKGNHNKNLTKSILYCIDLYINSVKNEISAGTLKNHAIKRNNFEKFQKFEKQEFNNITFDLATCERFLYWYKISKQTNNKTTAVRNVLFLIQALKFALKRAEIKEFSCIHFEAKKDKKKNNVFLTESELEKIIMFNPQSSILKKTRDLFLFQCATGLSYCDLFSTFEIKTNEKGSILVGTRGKNSNSFFIPVDPLALELLKKYDYKLPKMENPVYNRVLKEVAGILEIDKHLTTHIGRKTFATLKNAQGWTRESIALMLGHRSIRTTETYYLGESFARIENELEKLSKQ